MEYSSLKILGGYVIKRNHHVSSLDLNGPKINAIYLEEFLKKINDMMAWCNANDATNKTNHTTKLGVAGSLLERRSRGVTTLHHYKRISSRDLGWHRRENGRGREEVKLSCFFDKRVKTMNLERLSKMKGRKQRNEQSWKRSVRKEGQGIRREPRGLVIR